ncbi:MAG: rhomboid family-domain-containing protein [Olpidium bornovanus]|uniref:Rhomboid family-domain-containing protein n=1 Tax=Olpidium bornovanus TaxID=278681 RepID=A0A8H8DHE0_9FUNG|nr:MAG: rhomboid family-domain-containing protein [Olpidium bornovanus]
MGIPMERQIGSLRMVVLYVLSGVGGNLFGAIMTDTVSVGVSSSLYGLYGLLCLDLFQNWPLLSTPWRDAAQLLLQVAFALALGVVFPYIDNYAHVGGFVVGLLGGLALMPTIKFGRADRARKFLLKWASVPVLAGLLSYGFWTFYGSAGAEPACRWCYYLNCAVEFWCPRSSNVGQPQASS